MNDRTSNQCRTSPESFHQCLGAGVSITGCHCMVVSCYRRELPALLGMLSGWGHRHQKSEARPYSRTHYNLDDVVGPNSMGYVRVPASRALTVPWSVHLCYKIRKNIPWLRVGGWGACRHWSSTQEHLRAYGWSATLELRPSGSQQYRFQVSAGLRALSLCRGELWGHIPAPGLWVSQRDAVRKS